MVDVHRATCQECKKRLIFVAADARTALVNRGWMLGGDGGDDLCPDCADAIISLAPAGSAALFGAGDGPYERSARC